MADAESFDIAVVGAGPAGVAVAVGLARLGHRVVVLGTPRAFNACEGISSRVGAHLLASGLLNAAHAVGAASPRRVDWNSQHTEQGSEHLVWRATFDAALARDLSDAGVRFNPVRVDRTEQDERGQHALVCADGSRVRAGFLVEARGRVAPRASAESLRGPESVALLRLWKGQAAAPGSAVFAFRDGWAWMARLADGTRCVQFTVDATSGHLLKRASLEGWFDQRLRDHPQVAEWVMDCSAMGPVQARGATSLLQAPLSEDARILRVGDAAMAVDPLSGNGVFQSLSSASIAPAVINTWLRDAENAALARDFYAERVRHVFLRFARTGRDFHHAETRWSAEPFWRHRAAWPDDLPVHAQGGALLGIGLRPVVDNGWVREREVVLCADQPLGIWQVAGVDVAPLLRAAPAERAALVREKTGADPRREQLLIDWLHRLGQTP